MNSSSETWSNLGYCNINWWQLCRIDSNSFTIDKCLHLIWSIINAFICPITWYTFILTVVTALQNYYPKLENLPINWIQLNSYLLRLKRVSGNLERFRRFSLTVVDLKYILVTAPDKFENTVTVVGWKLESAEIIGLSMKNRPIFWISVLYPLQRVTTVFQTCRVRCPSKKRTTKRQYRCSTLGQFRVIACCRTGSGVTDSQDTARYLYIIMEEALISW